MSNEERAIEASTHRREMLNALLVAWDAHPDWALRDLMAAVAVGYYDGGTYLGTDAETLANLRELVKEGA